MRRAFSQQWFCSALECRYFAATAGFEETADHQYVTYTGQRCADWEIENYDPLSSQLSDRTLEDAN